MIDRRAFLKVCAALGLTGTAACSSTESPSQTPATSASSTVSFGPPDRVLVIGAGAAGMSAGHLLAQRGVDFEILEAAPTYGGRIKTVTDFVDFPIPLGAEWLHASARALDRIVHDDDITVTTQVIPYRTDDLVAEFADGSLRMAEMGTYDDLKFVDATWLTFFEDHVLPGIDSKMQFDTPVTAIDWSDDSGVLITDASGKSYHADAVVVTVPVQVLKDRDINFAPPLPDHKLEAIDNAYLWGGMKVFLEFSERFYPVFTEIEGTNNDDGQKSYYDAAYGQDSSAHVLGLFTVGDQSLPYQTRTGDELVSYILDELDEIFDGAASRSYLRHLAQNWNDEPFIRQAYFADSANWRLPPIMQETVGGRIFFAGDAYTNGNGWGEVHIAAQSAREAVSRMFR